MGSYYQAEIHITKQEDGLWRLSVPEMKGAWVDSKTLEEGFSEIQEAIALAVTYYQEHDWPLPRSVTVREGQPAKAVLPILTAEYQFSSPPVAGGRGKRR